MDAKKANGETYFLIGEAQRALEHYAEAEAAYNQAIDKKYRQPASYTGLAHVLIATDRSDEVAKLVAKPHSKAKNPIDQAKFEHVLGLADLAQGKYADAQTRLLGARFGDEDNMVYREALARAYSEGQIPQLALMEWEAVYAADSTRLDVLYEMAEIHYNQRQLNRARPMLTNLLQRDSTFHRAYFMLANIYMIAAESRSVAQAREQYVQALSLYRRAREVDPNSDVTLVAKNIALVYYYINAHDSAIVELNRAIVSGAGGKDPELFFYLGRSNMLKGNYAEAAEAFGQYRIALENSDPPHEWTKSDAELFWRTAACLNETKDSTV